MYLQVFSDNQKALQLYNRIGFQAIQKVPLIKSNNNGTVYWTQNIASDYTEISRYFVTMKLKNHGIDV